jgi:hypothetical protein
LSQAALAKQIPVQYNKEIALNPYFVVYGKTKKLQFAVEHGTLATGTLMSSAASFHSWRRL